MCADAIGMSVVHERIYALRKLLQSRNNSDTDSRNFVYIALQALEAAVMRRASDDVLQVLEQAMAGKFDVQELVNSLWARIARNKQQF